MKTASAGIDFLHRATPDSTGQVPGELIQLTNIHYQASGCKEAIGLMVGLENSGEEIH